MGVQPGRDQVERDHRQLGQERLHVGAAAGANGHVTGAMDSVK